MASVTQDPEAWTRLGAKIREQREARGLSRRQLSEVASVSEKSIQVAEEGRIPRARWPQSLTLIEEAIGWQRGSMMNVLEGGEPWISLRQEKSFPEVSGEHLEDRNFRRRRNPHVAAESAADEIGSLAWRWYLDHHKVDESALPDDVAELLPSLGLFADRCLGFGVPSQVITVFEGMIATMLKQVANEHRQRLDRWARQTFEENDAEQTRELARVHKESVELKDFLVERLKRERSAPPDAADREANIRELERGIKVLEGVIERSAKNQVLRLPRFHSNTTAE